MPQLGELPLNPPGYQGNVYPGGQHEASQYAEGESQAAIGRAAVADQLDSATQLEIWAAGAKEAVAKAHPPEPGMRSLGADQIAGLSNELPFHPGDPILLEDGRPGRVTDVFQRPSGGLGLGYRHEGQEINLGRDAIKQVSLRRAVRWQMQAPSSSPQEDMQGNR